MSLKSTLKVTEFLFIVLAVFLLAVFGTAFLRLSDKAVFAEEGETVKEEFNLTSSDVVCLADGISVTVFFTDLAFCNEKFDYDFSFGAENRISDKPYLTGLENLFPDTVTLSRPEDETYLPFSLTVAAERVAKTAVLPEGQIVRYKAASYEYEGAEFYKGGTLVTPFDAGDYEMLAAGKEIPFRIEKSVLTVSSESFSRRYLEEKEYSALPVVGGSCTEEERAYVLSHTEFAPKGVDKDSGVGSYTVSVTYDGGEMPNFTVVVQNGFYFVTPALLNGFTLDSAETLYDGKAHSLKVEYDETLWTDVTVKYNIDEVTDAGKYLYEVTVSKENYEDLVLQAYLTIRTSQLESSNLNNYVCLYGAAKGYDPSCEISLTESSVSGISEAVSEVLADGEGYKESVLASYDVNVNGGEELVPEEGEDYSLKIKLYGLDSSSGVRVLQYDGTEVKQLDYVFENGYFLIEASSLKGIVFVKSFPVKANDLSDYVLIAIAAAVVLIFVAIIIGGLSGGRREKSRSRRKHSRWA